MADQDMLILMKLAADREIGDALWGFHAQQATEKLLKSLLAIREVRYPFTHQLFQLMELMDANRIEVPEPARDLCELTPFAAELRYTPTSEAGGYPPLDRAAVLGHVRTLRDWVRYITGL